MPNDLNRCDFIGRLGADPTERFTPGGKQVVNFNIACGWKGKSSEGVEWIPIVAWEKAAELCAKYLKKGSQVYISGRFVTRKWQDDSGNTRYKSEVIADKVQFLDARGGASDAPGGPSAHQGGHGGAPSPQAAPDYDGFDDDIGF